jgi:xanthine dehydrogenase accessory factor
MNRVRAIARDWLARGVPAVVVEVLRVEGSAPRHAGTRMLVAADRIEGTIGGGHLEFVAIAAARQVLAGAEPPPDTRYALGPSLGQCCGGVVWLRLARLDAAALAAWPPVPPRLRVAVAGNGHVGRALVALLATLPVEVDWLATLPEDGAPPADLSSAEGLVRLHADDDPLGVLRDMIPGTHLRILTHSHALDFALAEAALRDGRFGSVGVIGSHSKAAGFRRRLLARGLAPATVAGLQCPIGLPGITGREPGVIAVAIVAQLLAATRAGDEGRSTPASDRKARSGAAAAEACAGAAVGIDLS